jgi:CHAT domain-containing protein
LVNAASTSQLIQQFYQNLAIGSMSKAEALQQAQISLITGKQPSRGEDECSSVNLTPTFGENLATISRNLSHPDYCAPFILIGNGL